MPLPPPHFNVMFIGGTLSNGIATRHFVNLDPKTIDWVYIVEASDTRPKRDRGLMCW
jgi:hypothetical protein